MQTVAIIPARYGSTRFPGKPLISIAGTTMVRRVYEGVKALPLFDDVMVATDDARIFDHVTAFGGKAVMTATTHQSGTERCAEVVEGMAEKPAVVINVQGDTPFIDPNHLRELIECFQDPLTEIATLVKKIEDHRTVHNPNIPKVVFSKNHLAIYFSRSAIPHIRDVEMNAWHDHFPYYKHIGIYGYRTPVLQEIVRLPAGQLEMAEKLEQLRWIEHGYAIRVAETRTESIAIDSPEDLSRLLAKMEGKKYLD